MRSQTFGILPLAFALPFFLLASDAASAWTLFTEYSVKIRGFSVGRARLQAEFSDGRYTIQFSGGVTGLARLFSDAETSAAAVGDVGDDRLRPTEYKHIWKEDNETESVDLHFSGRSMTDVSIDPPREHPERYVPLTKANTADTLDMVSAFIWPVAGGVTPDICSRTLPLTDGKRRFDIALRFNRLADFATSDRSYRNHTVVCSFSYEPVAGQRIDKPEKATIVNGDGMEVWMAPAGAGLAAPARIQLSTRIGRVELVATKFRTQ
jgi:Protein of unknown function (DUF3108)